MQPYYFITGIVAKIVKVLQKAVDMIRFVLEYLRFQLNRMFSIVIGRIVNVMVPIRVILTKIKDTLQKTIGVAVTGLYTVYGAYLAVESLYRCIFNDMYNSACCFSCSNYYFMDYAVDLASSCC